MSVLCRGSLEEKIDWIYNLYDPQKSGYISWHRLYYIITAIDDLIGFVLFQLFFQKFLMFKYYKTNNILNDTKYFHFSKKSLYRNI